MYHAQLNSSISLVREELKIMESVPGDVASETLIENTKKTLSQCFSTFLMP